MVNIAFSVVSPYKSCWLDYFSCLLPTQSHARGIRLSHVCLHPAFSLFHLLISSLSAFLLSAFMTTWYVSILILLSTESTMIYSCSSTTCFNFDGSPRASAVSCCECSQAVSYWVGILTAFFFLLSSFLLSLTFFSSTSHSDHNHHYCLHFYRDHQFLPLTIFTFRHFHHYHHHHITSKRYLHTLISTPVSARPYLDCRDDSRRLVGRCLFCSVFSFVAVSLLSSLSSLFVALLFFFSICLLLFVSKASMPRHIPEIHR